MLFLHKSLRSISSVAHVIYRKKILHRLIQNSVVKETRGSMGSYKELVHSYENASGKLLKANVKLLDNCSVGPKVVGDRLETVTVFCR